MVSKRQRAETTEADDQERESEGSSFPDVPLLLKNVLLSQSEHHLVISYVNFDKKVEVKLEY